VLCSTALPLCCTDAADSSAVSKQPQEQHIKISVSRPAYWPLPPALQVEEGEVIACFLQAIKRHRMGLPH
jgi:hypothetical protein